MKSIVITYGEVGLLLGLFFMILGGMILLLKSYMEIKKLNESLKKITSGVEKYFDVILAEEESEIIGKIPQKENQGKVEEEAIFNAVLQEFFT